MALPDEDTSAPASRGVESFLRRARNAAERYHEWQPAPDLAGFVACGWVRVVRQDAGTAHAPVIPDGCADIITFDHLEPVLVGPDTKPRWPELADGTVITGLRFRPGALRAVIGCSASELVDTTVDLSDAAIAVRELHTELHGVDTLHGRFALLEAWVRARLRASSRDLAVIRACHVLGAQPSTELARIAAQLGWSVRTLHREFVASCGYGPKTMQRILRVQHVVRMAHRARAPVQLSDVAASGGFADQAHMSREFRALTGFTPTHYLSNANPAHGRWLDADWSDGRR